MAWYNTGTVAVSGTAVTGTGTNFLDPKFGVGEGQAFLIPGSGTVKIYEIASVTDATHLTLKTSAGTVAAGSAYAVMSFYTDSVPAFAARLAAQLGYYQSQMNGWQTIMTGTGTVAITAPDGTVVNISSFSQLTADINSAIKQISAQFTGDVNTITAAGIYTLSAAATNTPLAVVAQLEHIPRGTTAATQVWHSNTNTTAGINRHYVRTALITSGVPAWSAWEAITLSTQNLSSGANPDNLTASGNYYGSSLVGAPGTGSARLTVISTGTVAGAAILQTLHYATGNTEYRRSYNGTWSAWAQVFGATDIVPISNGGTGSPTAAGALTALGAAPLASPAFTGNGSIAGNFTAGAKVTAGPAGFYTQGVTGPTVQGTYVGWNSTGLVGGTDLVCNRGSGDGGFRFRIVNSNNTAVIADFTMLNTGQGVSSAGWTAVSDIDVKMHVVEIDPEEALTALTSWRTCSWDYCSVPSEYDENGKVTAVTKGAKGFGFIAQDVQKDCPDAVTLTKNPQLYVDENGDLFAKEDTLSLNTLGVSAAYAGAAIKALKARCEKQELMISALMDRLTALESK